MTKKEIVKTISEEIGMTQLKTKEIVQKTFEAIVTALVEEGRIELRNFGVFEVKRRAARKARNPRTGDQVYVPQKFVVTFKPGKKMEEKVLELEARTAAAEAARNATAARSSNTVGALGLAGRSPDLPTGGLGDAAPTARIASAAPAIPTLHASPEFKSTSEEPTA